MRVVISLATLVWLTSATTSLAARVEFFGNSSAGTGQVPGGELEWTATPANINPIATEGADSLTWGLAGNPFSSGLDFDIELTFPAAWRFTAIGFEALNTQEGDSEFRVQMFDVADMLIDLSAIVAESNNGLEESGWTYDEGDQAWHYVVLQGSMNGHTATLTGPLKGVKRILVDIDDHLGVDAMYLDVAPSNLPGDGNGDGWVDGLDYLLWAGNFASHPGSDGDASDGDYNDDGWVDGLDYLLWADNFGSHVTNVSVPEPAAFALFAVGLIGTVVRCRQTPITEIQHRTNR